jgi:hypothetical protein
MPRMIAIHQVPTPDWSRRDTLWCAGFSLLALATMLSTIFGSPVDDTWRDIYFAHRIAYGEEFPLRGPVIGNIAQLGPVWFYLLAPAYALGGVAGALGLLGLLSGLKYPLAFVLGRRLGGTGLGAAFALAWLLPLWNAIETGWPTHISVVATALLMLALVALAYRRAPHPARAFVLGLCAGLAVHAHPTTALLAALLVAMALLAVTSWRARAAHAAIATSAVALLFAPVLIAAWLALDVAPDNLIGLGAHAEQLPLASIAERFGPVLRGLFWGAAEMQWRVLLGLSSPAQGLAFAITGLAWLLVGIGWIASAPSTRRYGLVLLGVLLLQTGFVLALRPITPFWMSFAHGPLLMMLIGVGSATLWRQGRAARSALVAVAVPLGAALLLLLVRIAPTAWQRLGRTLCEPATIYGHFAALFDVSFALGARRACGRVDQIAIGGLPSRGSRARIGLSAQATRALGLVPPTRGEGLRLFDVTRVHAAGEPMAIVVAGRYPRRDLSGRTLRRTTLDARTAPDQVLAVAWRGLHYYPLTVHAVHADGRRLEPVYQDAGLWLYRCTGCAGTAPVSWQIVLVGVPELIDVLSFDPAVVAY